MKTAACFVAAALMHALLLFGFRMGTPASPLAMSDEPSAVDVSLVETAPEAPAPAPEPVSTAEPEQQATPEPAPDMSTPPPAPESTPQPAPPKPPHHPEPKHPKISMPHSAGGSAPALAARTAAAAGVGRGAAGGPLSSRARYLSNPRPEYPPEARLQHEQGVVMVNVEVGADGRPGDVTLAGSSGYPVLDEAALAAVRRWVFEPARAGDLAVPSRVEVPVRFSLSN